MLSYAILFLEEHPELKRKLLRIFNRFPNITVKLRNWKQATTVNKKGRSVWKTFLFDISTLIIQQTIIQKLLSKILSGLCHAESKLQKIIKKPQQQEQATNQLSILNSKEEYKLRAITPQARRIYYSLQQAIKENKKG